MEVGANPTKLEKRIVNGLAAFSLTGFLGFALPPNLEFIGYPLRLGGAVSGVAYCFVATTPSLLKQKQQQLEVESQKLGEWAQAKQDELAQKWQELQQWQQVREEEYRAKEQALLVAQGQKDEDYFQREHQFLEWKNAQVAELKARELELQRWARDKEQELQTWYQNASATVDEECRKKLQLGQEQLEKQAAQVQEFLDAQRQAIAAEYETLKANLLQEVENRHKLLETKELMWLAQIRELEAALELANAPKRPIGIRRIDNAAKAIIDVCVEYGAPVDFDSSQVVPGADIIWVKLREEVTQEKFKKAIQQLPHRVAGIQSPPEVDFGDGFAEVIIPLDPKHQKESPLATEVGQEKVRITPPPTNHLERIVEESNMFFISGPSGSGKSELQNNLTNLMAAVLHRDYGIEIEVFYIDPKFPDTIWCLNGAEVLPQYQGYEIPGEDDYLNCPELHGTAVDGVLAMGKQVRQRLRIATAAVRQKKKAPARDPQIWILDEGEDINGMTDEQWEELYERARCALPLNCKEGKQLKRAITNSIKSTYRVGRSTKIKCAVMGQSWLPSDYGFRIANLNNATQIYLGSNIKEAIRKLGTTPEERKRLYTEYAAYQNLAQTDNRYNYLGLFKLKNEPTYLAPLPPPKFYNCDHARMGKWQEISDSDIDELLTPLDAEEEGEQQSESISPQPKRPETTRNEVPDTYSLVEMVKRGETSRSFAQQGVSVTEQLAEISGEDIEKVKYCLLQGMNQTETIKHVWKAKPGDNAAYKGAVIFYKKAVQLITEQPKDAVG